MTILSRDMRNTLRDAVAEARDVAEDGAGKVIEQLGVGRTHAPAGLTDPQIALRTRLRAHGRQLGDGRNRETNEQQTDRLRGEIAYEHWHRMLFARFLVENDLLREPTADVPLSLSDLKEYAREEGRDWMEVAAKMAQGMLPQIFRTDDPALAVRMPPETMKGLEQQLARLPADVFTADDALGWTYQFWQAREEERVRERHAKFGAEQLPAVTQYFTEDYMVLFLLHNTLGAWWAGKVLAANPDLAASAPDEAALRAACRVGDIDWGYLRFVREPAAQGETEADTGAGTSTAPGPWRPAAGTFPGWPDRAAAITLLDPCMGSGHFLVFALHILTALRAHEEDLSTAEAVAAVLRENLHGLEIDHRCTQIAAFNLAFTAWRLAGIDALPRPPVENLACSGLSLGVTEREWLDMAAAATRRLSASDTAAADAAAGPDAAPLPQRVETGFTALYRLFAKAPWLGSLIDPTREVGDLFGAGYDTLRPTLQAVLARVDRNDTAAREMAVAARGLATAADLLSRKFTLVATNVPYLGGKKQEKTIKEHCEARYPTAKADLATCFILRMDRLLAEGGTQTLVSPQNWLFLTSYRRLRELLLRSMVWNGVSYLGARAFATITGEVVNVCLATLTKARPSPTAKAMGIDAAEERDPAAKAQALLEQPVRMTEQTAMLGGADARIVIGAGRGAAPLSEHAICMRGIVAGDRDYWVRKMWEVPAFGAKWRSLQSTVSQNEFFGGRSHIINWETEGQGMHRPGSDNAAYGRRGVAVAQIGSLPATLYSGDLYDNNTAAIVPHHERDIPALWAFCSSPEFMEEVRKLDRKMNVTNATLIKIPFDIARWGAEAARLYPNGLPTPHSDDPTQWLFNGHPKGADYPLQVAVARLVGYRWPRQTGSAFPDCPALEPDGLEDHADNDGIVSLSGLSGEAPAHQRLQELLRDAWGDDWSEDGAVIRDLLAEAGYLDLSLENWLRERFFEQHLKVFGNVPFVWHIWDGHREGFQVLVDYHRLCAPNGDGRRLLERLIWTHLGNWISNLDRAREQEVEGIDDRLAAASHLKTQLEAILDGAPPFDLFARWKPLHRQPIGWEPDVDDGVRVNIRPWVAARTSSGGSIFRKPVKGMKWDKADRGKEPLRPREDYPWFWNCPTADAVDFMGDGQDPDGRRWMGLHYTRAAKQAARTRHARRAQGTEGSGGGARDEDAAE